MTKAVFLILVFSLPAFGAMLPIHHYGAIWIWLYIPFAILYGARIWFAPERQMMTYVTLTPVVFLIVVLVCFPAIATFEAGIQAGVQFFYVVAISALPIAILEGSLYVLAAYGIFWVFRRRGQFNGGS